MDKEIGTINKSIMASHWAFELVVLPGFVVFINTNVVARVSSALELLLIGF